MRQVVKSIVAVTFSVAAFLGAKSAHATTATDGVVFIHGTSDLGGTMTCTGSGGSTHCSVPAAVTGYWTGSGDASGATPAEINIIAGSHPWAVVGFNGATCAPWASGGEYGITDSHGMSGCGLASGTGNADVIASQIAQFMTTSGVTSLVLVTHSGGSNQARYILDNYTHSTNFTTVRNATKRVVTIAAPTNGTPLATDIFGGGISATVLGPFIAWAGYKGEGVNFIQTSYMSVYNGSSSFFGGLSSGQTTQGGVTFYATGGMSQKGCAVPTIFGWCAIPDWTMGGSNCDSGLDDTGLALLNNTYLSGSSADGFIPQSSASALGKSAGFALKQDHNQSRRNCNGLPQQVATWVNSANGSTNSFSELAWPSNLVDPVQVDACTFSQPGVLTGYNGNTGRNNQTIAYTEGCPASNLGNGNCDWDCIALYGHDAVPTWAGTPGHSIVSSWGSVDDCANTSNTNNTQNTYNGTTYADSTNDAWNDYGTFVNSSGTYYTTFNGYTCNSTSSCNASFGGHTGAAVKWFTDPNYGTSTAFGYCPQSWIGDGYCDECALALYGGDGTDCAPGHVTYCYGAQTASQPYSGSTFYGSNNGLYNELNPTYQSVYSYWSPAAATAGDQICESSECTLSTNSAFSGTSWCITSADCASGSTCSNNGCTLNSTGAISDCSATYSLPSISCTEHNQCDGNYCLGGSCAVTGGTCSTDGDCGAPTGATSTCSSSVCTCTTNADCSNGGTCTGGSCTTTVTQSLCR